MPQEKNKSRTAFKVVEIISKSRIVINAGSRDGLTTSSEFLISGIGNMISDPDTGEELERLQLYRGRGRAYFLQEKICTIESITTRSVPVKSGLLDYQSLVFGGKTATETIAFQDAQIGDLVYWTNRPETKELPKP